MLFFETNFRDMINVVAHIDVSQDGAAEGSEMVIFIINSYYEPIRPRGPLEGAPKGPGRLLRP